jgi:hypothetical protein
LAQQVGRVVVRDPLGGLLDRHRVEIRQRHDVSFSQKSRSRSVIGRAE